MSYASPQAEAEANRPRTRGRNSFSYRGARRNAMRAIGELSNWRNMKTFQIAKKVSRWVVEPVEIGVGSATKRVLKEVTRLQYVHETYALTMQPRRR